MIGRKRARPVQREAAEQRTLFEWCFLNRKKHPALELIFAIPNGGSRNVIEAHNLKLGGVKAGVPDVFLPFTSCGSMWPNGPEKHGLFIEMKSGKGKMSEAQTSYIYKLRVAGYRAEVCYGWEEAAKLICEHLNIDPRGCGLINAGGETWKLK